MDPDRTRGTLDSSNGRYGIFRSVEISYDNLAIYEDCLESAEGVWRFASRSYHYIWLSEAPLLGRSFPLPTRSYPSTTLEPI